MLSLRLLIGADSNIVCVSHQSLVIKFGLKVFSLLFSCKTLVNASKILSIVNLPTHPPTHTHTHAHTRTHAHTPVQVSQIHLGPFPKGVSTVLLHDCHNNYYSKLNILTYIFAQESI